MIECRFGYDSAMTVPIRSSTDLAVLDRALERFLRGDGHGGGRMIGDAQV